MFNQKDSNYSATVGAPEVLSDDNADEGSIAASTSLARHLAAHLPRRMAAPPLLPAELTSLHAAALPKAPARQRAQLLTFAIEDRIGAPIDAVTVTELPRPSASGVPLALVADRAVVAALSAGHMPEVLALSRPSAPLTWHVWRDGGRVLVRASDGTGFAVAMADLMSLWSRGGKPALIAMNAPLDGLPHTTMAAPKPDPKELAFRLYPPAADPARRAWRPLAVAASVGAVALVAHLGIAAADTMALGQRATAARAEAEAALAAVLPGIAVTPDTGPLLARLAPRAVQAQGSDVVPMLADVSAVLLATGTSVTLRRVRWGDGRLEALVLAPRLEDLQSTEQALEAAGFLVDAGASSAGEGGAEAEMTIIRGAT